MSEAVLEKIRVVSSRHSRDGNSGEVTLRDLTKEEVDKVIGLSRGTEWVCVKDGRFVFRSVLECLPGPIEDPITAPHWKMNVLPVGQVQYECFAFDKERLKGFSPSISISSLCGYYYTPEKYREEAAKLERWGFDCLRSRREDDGGYWEVWKLPGLWSAKAELAEAISVPRTQDYLKDEQAKLEKAITFLQRNTLFGSLDVTTQRLAMVMDD